MIYDCYQDQGDTQLYNFINRIYEPEYPGFRIKKVKIQELKEATCIQCKKTSYERYNAYFCSKQCVEKLLYPQYLTKSQ